MTRASRAVPLARNPLPPPPRAGRGLRAAAGLAGDLDVLHLIEGRGERPAERRMVVDDQNPQRHRSPDREGGSLGRQRFDAPIFPEGVCSGERSERGKVVWPIRTTPRGSGLRPAHNPHLAKAFYRRTGMELSTPAGWRRGPRRLKRGGGG